MRLSIRLSIFVLILTCAVCFAPVYQSSKFFGEQVQPQTNAANVRAVLGVGAGADGAVTNNSKVAVTLGAGLSVTNGGIFSDTGLTIHVPLSDSATIEFGGLFHGGLHGITSFAHAVTIGAMIIQDTGAVQGMGSFEGNADSATSVAGSPSALQYYGTDEIGNKGFWFFPSGLGSTNTTIISTSDPRVVVGTNSTGYTIAITNLQPSSANLSNYSSIATSAFQGSSATLSNYSSLPTSTFQGSSANLTNWGALATTAKENTVTAGTTSQYYRGDKTFQTLDKTAVGLANVANTAQVTSVAGTTPIASSGGTTPTISIANAAADGSTKGAATFNVNDFNSSLGVVSIDYNNGQASDDGTKGFLTAADHVSFAARTTVQQATDIAGTTVTNLTAALVGSGTVPTSITVGSSPFNYTNTSSMFEVVYVFGGTVSVITLNGVSIGSNSPPMLGTNDYCTVTYTATPNMIHKALFR